LAYTPEEPPARDYFFQYSWIIPEIFDKSVNLREHRYFGSPRKSDARFLFDFWENVRNGNGAARQDGLARICRAQLQVDPFCGWLFVFCNRRRTAVKILTYDGQGFWVCHKRLSQGKFPYWPTDGPIQELQAHQLQVLLMGADPLQARGVSAWRPLPRVA
jgi:hypothetical protein